MDRILFGDNQFFGINHMSEERARQQAMKFQTTDAIIEVLQVALHAGAKGFMCTTHETIAKIADDVRARPEAWPGFTFYPGMPYAHKYANAVTEHGMMGALEAFLPKEGAVSALLGGVISMARKDVERLATMLIDAEMKMFHDLETPVIFLQNVVTDLILGLGMHDVFRMFCDHVKKRYNAEPGFITMNVPRLLDALESVGIENPIICANINKIGFRMCGGVETYEKIIASRRFRPVAMSVLASGAIPPAEAIDYVCKQPQIEAIVFGASSRGNIRQTKSLIGHHAAGMMA